MTESRERRKRKRDGRDGVPSEVHQASFPRKTEHDDHEEDCSLCKKIQLSTEFAGSILMMHVDIRTVSPPCRKRPEQKFRERQKKEDEKNRILKRICALRNTIGGCLMIYFEHMEKEDSSLAAFDEMIDDRLYELIEDGTLFSHSYRRQWHKKFDHVLCITCNSSCALSTVDYKTQINLNKGFARPITALNIQHLLKVDKPSMPYTEIPLNRVQESSTIQLKWFRKSDVDPESSLDEHIMSKLRLREYIAAFANQNSGGHYFLGIRETAIDSGGYNKKTVKLEGMSITEAEERALETDIRRLVKNELLWVDKNMRVHNMQTVDKSVNIMFRKIKENHSVMEVFVSPVEGVVFYDKSGPMSFKLSTTNDRETLDKTDIAEWHKKILEIKFPV